MTEVLIRDEEIARLARKILSGLATEQDLETADAEEVRAIKCDTGEMHYRAVAADAIKVDGSDRRRKFIASQESTDRMGDVIRVGGWDFRSFQENAQVLWAHQDRGLPIGLVTEIEKGETNGVPTLFETIDYHSEKLNPQAEAIFRLVEAGAIKAVSVGFLPVKTMWPKSEDERREMGLGPRGVLYEKQEQLELSNCTVPAHPAALASKGVRKALLDLVEEGKLGQEAADSLIEGLERRSKGRNTSWWGYSFRADARKARDTGDGGDADGAQRVTDGVDAVERAGVDAVVATMPKIADEMARMLNNGSSRALTQAVRSTLQPDEGLSAKLDRCLSELAELRDTQDDITKSLLVAVDEIADLRSVLRSSARSVNPGTFYASLLNAAK